MLAGNDIRDLFLNYFVEKHNSTRIQSSSLVPDNPTVLLTTAGMLQFVPYFLGYETPKFSPARATTCQKCARAGGKDSDIENVGRTPRHHTFFEMLGNFSFGDYFKKEIIPWAWEFVTEYLKLDKNRLWVTIYSDDDEAYDIWTKDVGVPAERVIRKGKKDNFWGPPGATGPCGPCSEIHYDLGEEFKCSDNCGIDTCECDRWVEIWNLVFMELFKDEEGNFTPLEKKNVDTGMGLERIAMVCQGKTSTFETDLLTPILNEVSKMSGVQYKTSHKTDVSLRIITDHARCVTFLINDGVIPGNEGRSYVLRMILRRALRHGKMLGLELPFLYKLVDTIIENYKGAYPDLINNQDKIKNTVKKEEERFNKTLDRGYKLIEEWISEKKDINGESAFKLYDTYGFPFELTKEIAEENGLKVDEEGFKIAMQEQKARAKAATQKINLTDDLKYVAIEKEFGSTDFIGYDEISCNAKIVATIEGEDFVDIILDKTPFYAESGGQIGDSGVIESDKVKLEVLTTFKVNSLFVHRCVLVNGEITTSDEVNAQIDVLKRNEIKCHHTSAHLLQAALQKVLGKDVHQAGSQVEPDRMRFDFTFDRAMSQNEIEKAENLINEWVKKDLVVKTQVMGIEEAKSTGAMALFGEKYEDNVRVVSIGDISKEFCGGCHASNSGELRLVKIVSESAIAAGTRRIEVVVSDSAFDFLNKKAKEMDKLSSKFKALFNEVEGRVDKLMSENKELQKELTVLKSKQAREKMNSFADKSISVEGGKLFVGKMESLDLNALKEGVEALSLKLGNSIIVIVAGNNIFVKVSDNFVAKGFNAGKIVQKIAQATDGKGGGRPQFAQGVAKDISGIDSILKEIENEIKN